MLSWWLLADSCCGLPLLVFAFLMTVCWLIGLILAWVLCVHSSADYLLLVYGIGFHLWLFARVCFGV